MTEDIPHAAWIKEKHGRLEVGPVGPIPTPGPLQLVVKNYAIALNPGEAKIQKYAFIPLTYPTILGYHIAGVVHSVGSEVTHFKPGDRVISTTGSPLKDDKRFGAMQSYSLTDEITTSNIGNEISFEQAVPLLSFYAAVSALHLHLNVERPASEPSERNKQKEANKGKTVLIWGGAAAIGGAAIQLAALAGYRVVSTCSRENFEYVSSLGAAKVYDYKDPEIVAKLKNEGFFYAIYDCAGQPSSQAAIGQLFPPEGGSFLSSLPALGGVTLPPNVKAIFVQYMDDYYKPENQEFTKWLYWDFLPRGIADKILIPLPPDVKGGLGEIQKALDELEKNMVHRRKLVILPQQLIPLGHETIPSYCQITFSGS